MNDNESREIVNQFVREKKLLLVTMPDPHERKKHMLNIDTTKVAREEFLKQINGLTPFKQKDLFDKIPDSALVFIEPYETFGFYARGEE
jgi:hypothetical protein